MNTKPCKICQAPIEITKHNHTKIYCGSPECIKEMDRLRYLKGPAMPICKDCNKEFTYKGKGRPKAKCKECIIASEKPKTGNCRYCEAHLSWTRNSKEICDSEECIKKAHREAKDRFRNKDIEASRKYDRELRSRLYWANPEYHRAVQRMWSRGEKRQTYLKKYQPEWFQRTYKGLRLQVINGYGSKCNCGGCSESGYNFLSIDHVNNDGNIDRLTRRSVQMLKYIVDNNFPPEYQILCYNCNMAKGALGMCPHQTQKE